MKLSKFDLPESTLWVFGVLKDPDLIIENNSETWMFWFEQMVAFEGFYQNFQKLALWSDELAFTSDYKLPATINPLHTQLLPDNASLIQREFMDWQTEKLLLDNRSEDKADKTNKEVGL